jgi:outer membrane protein assembly factor BamA
LSLQRYHKVRMDSRFNVSRFSVGKALAFAMVTAIVVFSSCSPTRRVKEGEYLLNRNVVLNNDTKIPDSELLSYARQKPNRKILGFWRFHLWIYSTVNQEKYKPRYERRLEKRRKLNEQRRTEGKKPKNKEPLSLAKWRLEVGEAPVIFDTMFISRSTEQIELYLRNHGFFNAVVTDSIIKVRGNSKMLNAGFIVNAGTPYKIKSLNLEIEDLTVKNIVESNLPASLIHIGDNYQTDVIDSERDRITENLKNSGYYAFVKNFISFKADSALGSHEVDLTMVISNPAKRISGFVDSTISYSHVRYRINDIYIIGDYTIRNENSLESDTLFFDNIHYISEKALSFRPKALKPSIIIQKNDLYSKKAADLTYSRISEYKSFKFINIKFRPLNADSSDLLNCEIQVSPKPRHAYTIQAQGTNTGGNLGVSVDLIYQNGNLLKGLELFQFRINGALEVQRILSDIQDDNQVIQQYFPFNTILFGPEVSLQLPKIPKFMRFLGSGYQKTIITTSYNFQQRPDYKRSIFNTAYGFTAKPNSRLTNTLNPVEINFVNVDLGANFENLLDQSNNQFLKNSFRSQLISAMRYSLIYNSQKVGTSKNFFFFQSNVESSGFLLNASRAFYQNPGIVDGKYVIFGVPFSQYLRFDTDFRYYSYTGKTSSIAIRNILGLGIPYNNSDGMPFVKSFFGGGANGNRAWVVRSLGPGSYSPEGGIRFDQIGDIKIEFNLEYRAKLYKLFEGAAFIDAGNIWLRKKDASRPNAEFQFDRFYNEFAIGAGLGLRLNFDFFIIRLDAAHPFREPAYEMGDRWSFNRLKMRSVNLNFGIGYPF